MATDRSEKRKPRVTFSITDQMDDGQVRIAQANGMDEPDAELQRFIYGKGVDLVLKELAEKNNASQIEMRQLELIEEQLELSRQILNLLISKFTPI